jgi:chromate reductase, NAD(P)H dehydrogenase (quinone)
MIQINILSGTDRPGSNALKVSNYVAEVFTEKDVVAKVYSLEDFPLKDVAGGRYGDDIPSVQSFNEDVLSGDGLVIVTPEYNGGFPGILKMFIDYLPFPESFKYYPLCFIGEADGYFGALRPVEQLQAIATYRLAHIYPERLFIPRVNKEFDEEEGLRDDFRSELLQSQVEGFITFTEQIREMELINK